MNNKVKEVKVYSVHKDFSIYEYDNWFRVTIFIPIGKYNYRSYEVAKFKTLEKAKLYIYKVVKEREKLNKGV